MTIDPAVINLKVGIEIHQQLATCGKLFCSCRSMSFFSFVDKDTNYLIFT
ncbi:MAG: hypothetical protein DLM72_13240 [Candidatus Nitrosopolaris wilkensis]|nr:MAG: hypothetical protein DLM72_13240 [Candidatus Nitrosopolaris wilkensis]